MPLTLCERPEAGENLAYFDRYIGRVPDGDLVAIMSEQMTYLDHLLCARSDAEAALRYAPEKWSVREVLGHLVDTERVFAFRAAAFSRNAMESLPSFDQHAWVAAGNYHERALTSILGEWLAVRRASLALIGGLSAEVLQRRGLAGGDALSVRAALCILPGHVTYHIEQLRTKYDIW
jgi:DinB superfamily